MRLQYLPDGSPDCPLIRIFDFTPSEARQFASVLSDLAAERISRVGFHELPGVLSSDGCELVLCLCKWDSAVRRIGPKTFECGFTAGTWDNIAGLIKPFIAGAGGFQWLAGVPGEAALLLSLSGQW